MDSTQNTPIRYELINSRPSSYDFMDDMPEEATVSLPDNDSPAMWQMLGERLCDLTVHPVTTSTIAFGSSGIAGGSAVIYGLAEAFFAEQDDCDMRRLDHSNLFIGLIAGFSAISLAMMMVSYLAAKARFARFTEAKSDALEALRFSTTAGSSFYDERTKTSADDARQGCCNISPNMTLGVTVGTSVFGALFGAFFAVLLIPTLLGGSGCDLSDFKVGSNWMIGASPALPIFFAGASYLAYKNRAIANEMISETLLLEEPRFFTDHDQEIAG